MAGYILVQVEIHDPVGFAKYRDMVPPTLEAYGGRYLVRGGDTETLEGDWNPSRLVVIEFDNVEQAKLWWDSKEYASAKKLRHETATSTMIVAQGMDN